jgi:hypothetical protein
VFSGWELAVVGVERGHGPANSFKAGDFIDHLRDFGVSRLASVPYFNGLLCKAGVFF